MGAFMKLMQHFVVIFVAIKISLYVKRHWRSEYYVQPISVEPGLGPVRNPDNTYNVLNEFPAVCDDTDWMLVMVSSGPNNRELRDGWRQRMAEVQQRRGIRVVFLVANTTTSGDQQRLEIEHEEEGDILQCGVKDGHRLLGYKILCGHVWAYEHCPGVRHVAKTDDNVEVDMDTLVIRLQSDTETDWHNLITGPTVCFGMPVIRSSKGGMRGNWSTSKEEFDRDWMPAFCVGFLSITTPEVGAKLAQVGLAVYGESPGPITQIEDSLITGVLRERLPELRLQMLEVRPPFPWRLFSYCSWLHAFKSTFLNDLIISKKSSRKGIQYVGDIRNPKVWRFFLCDLVEGILEAIETIVPWKMPNILWSVCAR